VLAAFRAGKLRTLVATDIAARGIDVDGISHVVNFDLPNVPETYVHRIGRTARAGADGIAISLCDADEAPFLRDIEKLIRMAIPATDRREAARRPQRSGAPGHAARPLAPTHGHQAQRGGSGPRRSQSQPRQTRGIAGVAFLNRSGKPGRNADRRPPH